MPPPAGAKPGPLPHFGPTALPTIGGSSMGELRMLSAEYFRRQSQICQRLSRIAVVTNPDIAQKMDALAREHQTAAEEIERQSDMLMPLVAYEGAPKKGRRGRRGR